MARRRKGRPVSGVLLLNKSSGMTSNDALQQAKRLFYVAKAGHTGSLDPLATGVLPLCFGEATKFSQFLLDADKRYRTTYRLGAFTTTGDVDGELLEQVSAAHITREQILAALEVFRGDIEQVPPMYSALKHNGEPLYKLARQGIEIDRPARPVTIYSIELLDFRAGEQAEVDLDIHCSKGTYIRSIAEDLGKALGCGAHVAVLHRSEAGPFKEDATVTLDELREERGEGLAEVLDHHLLPTDSPVQALPAMALEDTSAYYFRLGNPVMDPQVYRIGDEGDMVRVFAENGDFLGIGVLDDEGRVAPKRLVVQPAEQ
ncbi:tRNA pseudouridine(55) synthase TruB [Aestuariicella hydrocarbonica]|uniref:tRNA pseudouridine synthase B n=1 Tax=Pseudomaricurvus hydrocarbonicus TaxID=1470433 RepID=A0A9E5JYW4_9GAMM|nr:tRNA pseudouridine(55) synthase TruB [Aestuariicella hydrocarbonica]NHO64832.1 tRNA pseudouridine(55) synthase TruB [Aestuariicella hydrocarbonica]